MTKTALKPDPAARDDGSGRREDGLLEAVVGDNILFELGVPPGFHRLQGTGPADHVIDKFCRL